MKRKAKQNGSGGRLRLALLLATAAAFLLVPVAQAAAEGELTVNLAGTGTGKVTSEGVEVGGEELPGTPPIECSNIPGHTPGTTPPGEEVCENEMDEIGGQYETTLGATPGPGSEFVEWIVEEGQDFPFGVSCFTGQTEPECLFVAFETDAEITAVFDAIPTSTLKVEGTGTGSGTVTSTGGLTNLNCHITEGVPDEVGGGCQALGEEAVGIITTFTADADSEFSESSYAGAGFSNCSGTKTPCTTTFFSSGEEGTLTVTFEKKPENVFTIEGAGTGSGTVTSSGGTADVNCTITEGVTSGECTGETGTYVFPLTNRVELTVTPGAGSELVECVWAGGGIYEPPCEEAALLFLGSGEEGTLTVTLEAVTYPLNLSTSGSGSGELKCKVNGGSEEACKAEYQEGKEVEVLAQPATGSEFAGWTGCDSEPGGNCLVAMSEEKSVDAQFDIETFTLSVEVEGEGEVTAPGITCTEAGNGGSECEEDFAYGTEIEATATPAASNVLASLTGSGSAAGSCDKEAGTCEFAVGADSGVIAVFAGAETIAQQIENVHGEVPETTELATTCGNDIDLGIFTPGEEQRYWEVCNLTVTATGEVNELRAEDLTGKGEEGHLTQEAGTTYNLPEPLEISSESTIPLNGADTGGLKPLDEGGVTLMSYPTPVSKDNVEVEFSQWIREHDPLHTGVYSKQITLTLEQTTP